MIAFFRPRALFTSTVKFRENKNKSLLSVQNNSKYQATNAVVLFSHHRDVKVALGELSDAGFSSDNLTLIARHARRYSWNPELIVNSYFDVAKFGFNQVALEFFRQLFQKGKYLVLITGSKQDVSVASKIMSRRQDHSEAWYFD